jgi:general secretion pathway protein D
VKASYKTKPVPLCSPERIPMASLHLNPKGLWLAALLCASLACGLVPALAQDAQPTPSTDTGSPADSTNYQSAPVSAVLDLYEQLSGKHLIRDANLKDVPNVSIKATGLSKPEMLKLIQSTLLLNGVDIIPVDDNTAKVVTIGINKNPKSEGLPMIANAADLPAADEVVTYYMPLNYINPLEAQQIFTQVAPFHTYGSYTPAPSAQGIILTENTNTIRQLIKLKELIDVPPAAVVTEFVQLNRADVEKVADTMNKLLGQSATGAPAAGGPNSSAIVPANLGTSAPMSNEHNLISGTALVLPDTRGNRLIITTRPVNMAFLEHMASDLDQADIFMEPQRRPLKYVLAGDILPALESALATGKDEEDEAKKDEIAAHTSNPTQPQGAAGAPVAAGGGGGGGTGSVSAITPQLPNPPENNIPTVVIIGKTRLLADNRSNSIIVFGSPDVVARVFGMIDELDRKPLQVYLGTVIGQLTVAEGLEFGIDLLQKFQRVGSGGLSSSLVVPATTTSAAASGAGSVVPEPASLTSSLGFPLPTGLTLYGAIGSTLDAYVRALETTNRFKVISRPSVYTTNNKLAVIASGSQVPVPGSITSSFGSGTTTDNSNLLTTANVQYENVLLQLDIVPLINANHEVTLKIRQTNNSLGSNNIISGNNVPTILTQEINTEVTVPDKSTVVIGGLISDTLNRTTSGVPFLSDIPLLGYLFKDTTKNKERDELIIMIQPTVVETDADQIAVNEAEKQRTILGREAVEAATGVPSPEAAPVVLPVAEPVIAPQVDVKDVRIRTSTYNSKSGNTIQTTTTTTTVAPEPVPIAVPVPTSETPTGPTGLVPALSTPAPDVSNGQMPKYSTAPIVPPTSSH